MGGIDELHRRQPVLPLSGQLSTQSAHNVPLMWRGSVHRTRLLEAHQTLLEKLILADIYEEAGYPDYAKELRK